MSLFDSIINEAEGRFGLQGKSGTLLSALLALMTDQNRGGFAGFLDLFSKAGLGDLASSWISSGSNSDLSEEQVESALGTDTITSVAERADVNASTAKSALAYLIPNVVDRLTPDGVVPEEKDLLSRIGDFLSGIGGTVAGGVGMMGAVAGRTIDEADDAGRAVVNRGVEVADRETDIVDNTAETTYNTERATVSTVGHTADTTLNRAVDDFDGDGDGGILKWLLPLILLGLLLLLGFWFCGKTPPPAVTNNNSNANRPVNGNANVGGANSNFNSNTNAGANTGVNSNPTGGADRKLTEVSLPNGTKLQAYPGGIEDQLIKFVQSDEYKNGNNDSLKEKWFSFDDLNFKFGTSELVPESKRQLDNITAILKAFPDVKIKIGGYTDKKGDDASNKKLSDSRAKAVKAALEKQGVGAQVPEAEGYGEEFAKVPETASDEERGVDRKTAVRLIKGDAAKTTTANTNK